MACSLDNHPLIDDINDLLRSGKTYGEIRAVCLTAEAEAPKHYQFTRHKACLNIEKNPSPRRAVESEVDEDDDRIPEIQEIRNLALREFYRRLKKRPGSIDDRDLVSVLNKILQIEAGKVQPKDALDDFLGQLSE